MKRWGTRSRTQIAGTKTQPIAVIYSPLKEPPARIERATCPLQEDRSAPELRRRDFMIACPRQDSNLHCRPPQGRASCRWATRTWSRRPVPARITRATRAGPQPCAAALLGNLDSNQDERVRLPVQSRACCQLHHSPLSAGGGI